MSADCKIAGETMRPSKKILVIEDEAVIRDFLCDLLTSGGFDVTSRPDGPSGLKAAEHRVFDIIITDYDMPSITGSEVAKHFRTHFPASIIIGVSSDDRKEDFLRAGADAFLQKPYRHAELLARVHDEITYSLLK